MTKVESLAKAMMGQSFWNRSAIPLYNLLSKLRAAEAPEGSGTLESPMVNLGDGAKIVHCVVG